MPPLCHAVRRLLLSGWGSEAAEHTMAHPSSDFWQVSTISQPTVGLVYVNTRECGMCLLSGLLAVACVQAEHGKVKDRA